MNRRYFLDLAERTGWTFIQGTSSTLLLSGFLGVAAWKAAVVGGLAAVIAMVKGMAATRLGDRSSAALLPATIEATGSATGGLLRTATKCASDVTEALGIPGRGRSEEDRPGGQH